MLKSVGKFGMLKKKKRKGQHFVPELLYHGRETCHPSALAETNELIAKHVYAQGFGESRSKTFYGGLKT